jgi:hypothetical protein
MFKCSCQRTKVGNIFNFFRYPFCSSCNPVAYKTEFNWFNSESWFFKVKTGDLKLFPSSLTHNVEQKQGDNVRCSLAFNTFAKGYFGSEETLTALHL